MNRFITLFYLVLISTLTFGQEYNVDRYRSQLFPSVLSFPDVKYGEAPQWVWPYWDVDLFLDVFVPDGDDNPKRPLIIFAHAGGFINGSKEVDNMVAICDSFAQKGYVSASIDYRKGFDPLDGESSERAVYRAIQDGKAAVRYFKEHASLYDLDTNNFFFGGMSAGGFVSLHVGYMDKEIERPASTYGGGLVNDLECLDCAGNDFPHTSSVKAVLDFWGGVQDTTILEVGDVPMLIMHGEHDPVVPYVYGHPFGLFTLPESYGAVPLSERAVNVGIQHQIFTSTGDLHMLDGSDNGTFVEAPNSFWSDTLLPKTTTFLYELIKPNTIRISDDTSVVCEGGLINFEVSPDEASHFIWDYDTDLVSLVVDDNSNELALLFEEVGVFEISVVEFNDILCAGDTILFTVEVVAVVSDFDFSISDFNEVEFTNESVDGILYTWDFGDGEMSDEFEPAHTFTENGEYEVSLVVENELGCSDTSVQLISIAGLGVEKNGEEFVLIYPNPVIEQVIVNSTNHFTEIQVVDATGRLIVHYEDLLTDEMVINAIEWEQGVYFISILSNKGSVVTRSIHKK